MKTQKQVNLQVKKVSISKLNNLIGKGGTDLIPSVNFLCVITTEPHSIPGQNCKTFLTASDSAERC
ncbi:MAG: hypothetical protein AB8B65_19830 [Kordia sp.]|uniref:hypothetical protein n=1 Tax=Kordia sp. TaxID=1965332 RepID=UPI00385CB126